jgi:rod shape-determining protein MreC
VPFLCYQYFECQISNAKIKKSNHFGSLIWNGKSTGFVQLIDVPRLASVRKGDTIVTGMQSVIFPENINIGTIEKVNH